MIITQMVMALVFILVMISAKKKWVIIAGWTTVLIAGSLLYYEIYSSEIGRADYGVVMSATMSSVRNFLINMDFISYPDKIDASSFFALNIVCFLSAFMTLLTAVKIVIAYYSDNLYLLLHGNNRHICIFTDSSASAIRLASSVKNSVEKSLCIFVGCDRIARLESEKDILFLKESAYAHLRKYKSEVFICSEDISDNSKTFEKIHNQLPQSKYYIFAARGSENINKEELLTRYLFTSGGFIPKNFTGDEQAKICIIGDNRLAIEVCKELIVQCQSTKGAPLITIIGSDAEDNFAFFVKSNPGLGNCADLFFINAKPSSVAGIDALTNKAYHMYLFCDYSDDLPSLVPCEKTVELPKYEVIYDYDIIVNYSLDKEAKELNAAYECEYGKGKGKTITRSDIDMWWRELTEFHRQSNRSQAISIPSKKYLSSIGVPIERIANEEHLRWNAFHYINGWLYGKNQDGKKCTEKKLHPCLVPYDELPSDEKEKDMIFVNKILQNIRY